MNTYGFIITRHVNSEKTNNYWNYCIQCIRRFYPFRKIIIIDDNSNPAFIKPYEEYTNIEVVHSEYPRRGELLPLYYFYKNNYFENAVILHDSVFFQKRILFEAFVNKNSILPLWHFEYKTEDTDNCTRLCNFLKNADDIREKVSNSTVSTFGIRPTDKWSGCFGIQCFINRAFLLYIENKYNIFGLLKTVQTRRDRCSLERVMGAIFFTENSRLYKNKSILGNILHPINNWGLTFEQYMKNREKITLPLVKVWTGR
jgi:hypothetical protein